MVDSVLEKHGLAKESEVSAAAVRDPVIAILLQNVLDDGRRQREKLKQDVDQAHAKLRDNSSAMERMRGQLRSEQLKRWIATTALLGALEILRLLAPHFYH